MKNLYSIIIPVFNEKLKIDILLKNLEDYSCYGHEILVVDDGSTDGSKDILLGCSFIKLITYKSNKGKGNAIIKGLQLMPNLTHFLHLPYQYYRMPHYRLIN